MTNQSDEWDKLVSLAETRLIKARSKLMKGNIGMASMLLHLDLVAVSPDVCSTMATDGRRIIYNPNFILEVEEGELRGVLVHETLHVVYEHPLRRGKRHPKVWNVSCDYSINGFLVYDLGIELPEDGLLLREHHGDYAESIYAKLIKDEDALQQAINTINKGNDDEGEQDSDEGNSEGNEESQSDESNTDTGKYFSPSDVKTGEKVGNIDLDSIPLPTGEVWDAQDEGKLLCDPEMADLKGAIQRMVSLSEKLEKAMSDDGTSAMSNRMDQLKEAHVDWKSELFDFLQSTFASDNSWSRLNRRHSWRGINLPSKIKSPHGGEAALAIDTSYSVSQAELNMFATEIQEMAEACGLSKIRVCYCDSTVRKNEHGEWWDIFNLDEGDELTLRSRGGGGTSFDPPFNLFNDYSDDVENVKVLIYFTDGWGRVSAEVEPDVPVIWCLTDRSQYSEELPFGKKIYIDTSTLY